jgi:lysophospholipase L1-like esterase
MSLRTILRIALIVVIGLGVLGCATGVAPLASVPVTGSTGNGSTTAAGTTGNPGTAGSNGPVSAPSSTSVTVTAAQQQAIAEVTNFGDSITAGWGASAPQDGYAALLDTAIDRPQENLSRAGDQAADMTRQWVYPNATPSLGSAQLYTVLIGTNDAYVCGGSSGCIANWQQSLAASLAWLAVPASDKVLGNSIASQTGDWTPDLKTGIATTGAGASLSFTVQQAMPGRSLYVAYRVFDVGAGGGAAMLSVDGAPVATLSATVSTGQPIDTKNGTSDTIFVASVPLGEAGPHSITLTTTAAGFFSLQWAGVPSGDYAGRTGAPRVLIGSITSTGSVALNATVNQYNAELALLVADLTANGLNIQIAPTANVLQPGDFSDELHPNNAGHLLLAQTFAASL